MSEQGAWTGILGGGLPSPGHPLILGGVGRAAALPLALCVRVGGNRCAVHSDLLPSQCLEPFSVASALVYFACLFSYEIVSTSANLIAILAQHDFFSALPYIPIMVSTKLEIGSRGAL